MLRKIFAIAIISLLSSLSIAAENNGIAVVNTEKLRVESKAGKSIMQQLSDLQDKFKLKVDKLQKDFDTQKVELDKQKGVLSKEAFAKKEAEFTNKVNEARKQMQEEASGMEQMQQTALNDFNSAAMGVIVEIAKEEKYMQVFPAELLIYMDNKADITTQVIAKLDKKVDNIALKAPQAAK